MSRPTLAAGNVGPNLGVLVLLLGALMAPGAAAASGSATVTTTQEAPQESRRSSAVEMRRYPVRRTNMNAAYTLAEALCSEFRANNPSHRGCSVDAMNEEGLVFIATPELHDRLVAELDEVDVPPRSQRFHIAVLETVEGAGMPDELHDGAVSALEDLRSFLPYSGFRTLANGWLETSREGQTSLSGPGNFELELRFSGDPRNGNSLMVDAFQLTAVPLSAEEIRAWERSGEPIPRRIVLESTFGIDVGETKVLGTSKLNGDGRALVVLFTAVR